MRKIPPELKAWLGMGLALLLDRFFKIPAEIPPDYVAAVRRQDVLKEGVDNPRR